MLDTYGRTKCIIVVIIILLNVEIEHLQVPLGENAEVNGFIHIIS